MGNIKQIRSICRNKSQERIVKFGIAPKCEFFIFCFFPSNLQSPDLPTEAYCSLLSPPYQNSKSSMPCRAILINFVLLKMICWKSTKKMHQFCSDMTSIQKAGALCKFCLLPATYIMYKGTCH